MRKILSLLLALVLVIVLCACQKAPDAEQPSLETTATQADIDHLEAMYAGRTVYHGDLHSHSSTGKADGKDSLSTIKMFETAMDVDFFTVVDHRQVVHMRDSQWDDTCFIGGTEPGLTVLDCPEAEIDTMDYSMVFADPEDLEAVLNAYPEEYQYADGYFKSGFPGDHEKIAELIKCIQDNGGMFIHVHPTDEGYFDPADPMDYWFADGTGFEIQNGLCGDMNSASNSSAYKVWTTMLQNGKRVYATAGSDLHGWKGGILNSLTSLYAEQANAKSWLEVLRKGDFAAGPASIRMVVGDAVTGSAGSFTGNRLVVAVGDFHSQAFNATHTYRVDIFDGDTLLASKELDLKQMNYFAIDADPNSKYYRANVYDVTAGCNVVVGNPVWNQ